MAAPPLPIAERLNNLINHVIQSPGIASGAGLIALIASLKKLEKDRPPQIINEPYQGLYVNKAASILKQLASSPLLKQANQFSKKAVGLASALTAAGAGIGGLIGGPEGAMIGAGIGGGAGTGISIAPWLSSAFIPKSRARMYDAFRRPIDSYNKRVKIKQIAKDSPTSTIDNTTYDSIKHAPRSIPTAYIRGAGNAYGSMYTDPTTWIAAGVGGAVGGLGGGIGAAYTKGGQAVNFFKKANPLANLQSTWNDLDPSSKAVAGIGGVLATGSLLNNFNPDSSSAFNNLGALSGLALGAYGLSGNKLDNILPTIQSLFAGKQQSSPSSSIQPANMPARASFIKNDGSIDFLKAVKAQDQEIKNYINTMPADKRKQMLANIQSFKPSLPQALGAKALGIDIDEQKNRFGNLLR